MNFSIIDFLTLIGSLGVFIYGMKVMSEGLQKVAGGKMRQILRVMTSNRFKGVFTGFLITSLVQSSSATTVMIVSFVNAGLLSLIESIGVIMGANIGTTLTAWIISIVGFKIKIGAIALPLIGIGFPLIFSSKNILKSWGEVIIGFSILFMGLELLKDSVPDIKSNPEILEFLIQYSNNGFLSILLFVLIGTILTVIIQSSSATMALTLVMANQGWISFDIAAAMVLGENIGTTITANIAAVVANVNAKRTAFAHFIFNIFGVIWMLSFMPLVLSIISDYLMYSAHLSPYEDSTIIPLALSIFHSFFNIVNVCLLIWFIQPIASFVTKMINSTSDEQELYKLEYFQTPVISTPEIYLEEVQKHLIKFGVITSKMSSMVHFLIKKNKLKEKKKAFKKNKKYEEITDKMELEIAKYLTKLSTSNLSNQSSLRLRGMFAISNELERMADLFYQMSQIIIQKIEDDTDWFTDQQYEGLNEMFQIINLAFENMINNLSSNYDDVELGPAIEIENKLNKKRKQLRKKHLKSIENKSYDIITGINYSNLYNILERVGDHIINVTEGITGELARDDDDKELLSTSNQKTIHST